MAKSVLDLYELYKLVIGRGGLVNVINKKLWQEIIKDLNLPSSITSAAFTLRTQYTKVSDTTDVKLSPDSSKLPPASSISIHTSARSTICHRRASCKPPSRTTNVTAADDPRHRRPATAINSRRSRRKANRFNSINCRWWANCSRTGCLKTRLTLPAKAGEASFDDVTWEACFFHVRLLI